MPAVTSRAQPPLPVVVPAPRSSAPAAATRMPVALASAATSAAPCGPHPASQAYSCTTAPVAALPAHLASCGAARATLAAVMGVRPRPTAPGAPCATSAMTAGGGVAGGRLNSAAVTASSASPAAAGMGSQPAAGRKPSVATNVASYATSAGAAVIGTGTGNAAAAHPLTAASDNSSAVASSDNGAPLPTRNNRPATGATVAVAAMPAAVTAAAAAVALAAVCRCSGGGGGGRSRPRLPRHARTAILRGAAMGRHRQHSGSAQRLLQRGQPHEMAPPNAVAAGCDRLRPQVPGCHPHPRQLVKARRWCPRKPTECGYLCSWEWV